MRCGSQKYLFAACLLLIAGACVRRPSGVLSDKKMAPVVADMELAEAYIQNQSAFRSDEYKEAMISGILDKHHISRQDFDSTMSWYGRNPDKYYEFLPLVEKEIESRRQGLTGSIISPEESSDLWPYSRMAMLSPLSGSDAFTFSLPMADLEKGDKVNLRMRFAGQPSVDLFALLGVEYDNGSIGYMHRNLSTVRRLELALQTDTALRVKRIFGNFIVKNKLGSPLWIDSISLSSRRLDTLEYSSIRSQRTLQRRTPAKKLAGESKDSLLSYGTSEN